MNWQERIVSDPKVLVGKPIIKGTRIAVEFLIELLAEDWTKEDILRNYPQLVSEDIQAALFHAVELTKLEAHFSVAQEGKLRVVPLPQETSRVQP